MSLVGRTQVCGVAVLVVVGCKDGASSASAEPQPSASPSAAPIVSVATSASAPAVVSAVASAAVAPRASSRATGGQVYHWDPEPSTIPGSLVIKQIQWSDGPVPVVVFDAPIRVEGKPGETGGAPPMAGVKEAWLSYNEMKKADVLKLVGKKVTFQGTLNPAQTGHHLSDPWLTGKLTAR